MSGGDRGAHERDGDVREVGGEGGSGNSLKHRMLLAHAPHTGKACPGSHDEALCKDWLGN